ncbi:MAG: hypothetical protein J6I72_08495 [Muribaculaceae bacterium]|nr:hypothetical protein [Muribaculaceae bacterium]
MQFSPLALLWGLRRQNRRSPDKPHHNKPHTQQAPLTDPTTTSSTDQPHHNKPH